MQVRTAQPIATRDKPATDRRAVFVSIDNESATLDLLIAQQNDKFGQLRCIYVDTSAQDSSGNGCTIETDIGQKITALANMQGYYPVFVPFVTKLTISSNQAVTLLMLDFDMRPVTWPTILQSESVPDPLHVIIDDQPISTNATVQNWPASQPVTINGQPIEVIQTNTWSVSVVDTPLPVSQSGLWNVVVTGTVAAAQSGAWNISATQSGTWNVGITGTATVTWSTAKPVSVSNFPAIQPVSGTVAVSNFPATQPISGTVSAAQSGAWNVSVQNSNKIGQVPISANGTLTALINASNIAYIVLTCCNFSNSTLGTLLIQDPANNTIVGLYVPILTNFSGVLISVPVNLSGAGTGLWSFVTSGTTISSGILLLTATHN